MKTERIPFNEADKRQLTNFAKVNLGLDIDGRASETEIRSAIQRAMPDIQEIILFDMHSQEATQGVRSERQSATFMKVDENGREREYCRILIPIEDKPGGEEQVPVSVNGIRYDIPRGSPQDVPVEYVEALQNAEYYVYEPYTGEGLGGLRKPKVVKRFAFQYAS